ncbi:MAG: hypothetical protein ACRDPD_33695, partial [Streptosporangiaceae bacterium]
GYAETGPLGTGPAWCWLTPAGMTATGLGYPATRPALARLAHIRAVLAARPWLQAGPAWTGGQAWWHSERRLRAALRPGVGLGHLPDAEIHWPSLPHSPYAGQVWAVEIELTPKPLARTSRIMGGLLSPPRYAQVIYLTPSGGGTATILRAARLSARGRSRGASRDRPPARSR